MYEENQSRNRLPLGSMPAVQQMPAPHGLPASAQHGPQYDGGKHRTYQSRQRGLPLASTAAGMGILSTASTLPSSSASSTSSKTWA